MRKEFQIQRLEGMAAGMVHVLGIIIFALLCVTSLIFTRFFPAGYDPEIPYNQIDSGGFGAVARMFSDAKGREGGKKPQTAFVCGAALDSGGGDSVDLVVQKHSGF